MMKNPVHPARILHETLINGYGLTVEQAAKLLDVTVTSLSNFFTKKTKMKPSLAYRLEMAGIFNARFWMSAQTNYELALYINAKTKEPKVDVATFKKMQQQITEHYEQQEQEISKLYEQRKRAERENAVGDSTFDEPAEFTPVNVNIREHALA